MPIRPESAAIEYEQISLYFPAASIMFNTQAQATTVPGSVSRIPPLESGDRLTRHEFERRYNAMLDLKKAELIEGVVYVASPVRSRSHGQPHAAMMGWLFAYWIATPGVDLNDNTTVRLDLAFEFLSLCQHKRSGSSPNSRNRAASRSARCRSASACCCACCFCSSEVK